MSQTSQKFSLTTSQISQKFSFILSQISKKLWDQFHHFYTYTLSNLTDVQSHNLKSQIPRKEPTTSWIPVGHCIRLTWACPQILEVFTISQSHSSTVSPCLKSHKMLIPIISQITQKVQSHHVLILIKSSVQPSLKSHKKINPTICQISQKVLSHLSNLTKR